jgi:ligand-binding SRPBCC domain-containing protein
MVMYFVTLEQNEWSAKTNENNCQNKFIFHPEQIRTRVRTGYYYRQNKILLEPEQDIIIDRITYYYS